MANSYPGAVSAVQVGSYFVKQYYQVLQKEPNLVHQFYSDASSMIRVDGDSSESASEILQIHTLILSLNLTSIEVKTINSIDSWNQGILVVVSGSLKTRDSNGRRKFVQTFFLAPQDTGYFVLNDIFQYIDDEVVLQQHPAPLQSEGRFDVQLSTSSPHPEPPVSDYVLEEEAREYMNSVDIEDDPVDKYSLPEQQVQQDFENEVVVEETPSEETYTSFQNVANTVQDAPAASVEEPVGEPQKKTWASILRVAQGPSAPVVTQQPYYRSAQTASEWNYTPQPAVEQTNSAPSYAPESGMEAAEEGYTLEQEGELKSVYVRNLPLTVTEKEIEQVFKNFGQIKDDGIFVRARQEIGVCYAFVEYEDMAGVHNALKASPIELAERQVYIEERRPNSTGAARGRGRGRGRSSYPTESTRGRFGGRGLGRSGYQDGGDYNRARGNGFHPRGTR